MPSEVLSRDEQKVFINGSEVRGVQTVGLQYQVNSAPVRFLGMQQVGEVPSSPQVATVSIGHLLISDDILLPYTGERAITGYVVQDRRNPTGNIGFTSGYLTNYRVHCAVGQIPEISADIEIYGNVARIPSGNDPLGFSSISSGTSPGLKVASPGSMDLTVDGFNTNRVQSFDIQISVPRNPIFILGDRNPKSVEYGGPVEVTCSFSISAKDYNPYALRSYPSNPLISDVAAAFRDVSDNQTIISFNLPKLTLKSQSYNVDIDNRSIVNLTYNGYLTSPILRTNRLLPPSLGISRIKTTSDTFTSGKCNIRSNQFSQNQQGAGHIVYVSKQGLIAYWKMDSTGLDATIPDSHVLNNNLSILDVVAGRLAGFYTGIIKSGIQLGGSQTVLARKDENPNSKFFVSGTQDPLTISFWFYSSPLPIGKYAFTKQAVGHPTHPSVLGATIGQNFRCYFFIANAVGNSAGVGSINNWIPNKWNHVIMAYDNTGQKISIKLNNVLGDVVTAPVGGMATQSGSFYFWFYPPYGLGTFAYSYDGVLDEVGIWKRKLLDDEHTCLWNEGTGYEFSKFIP
jgi:hypothetical protein